MAFLALPPFQWNGRGAFIAQTTKGAATVLRPLSI